MSELPHFSDTVGVMIYVLEQGWVVYHIIFLAMAYDKVYEYLELVCNKISIYGNIWFKTI